MKLPNLSYMMRIGQLRYIQSVYEAVQFRNPDTLAGDLLSTIQRWACDLQGKMLLGRLRAQPFYYYVAARTRYYDAVFVDAIRDEFRYIVNVGCGSDTRAYRFQHLLRQKRIRVLECDQPGAIHNKRRLAGRLWPIDHVDFLPIDLNRASWPDFEFWMKGNRDAKMLVMLEGVSPYVNSEAFGEFLDFVGRELRPGSRVAYDFKLRGFGDYLGRSDRAGNPFRLPSARDDIIAYHTSRHYEVEHVELSADLSLRLLPALADLGVPLFREDGLVRLRSLGA
jgi:methyltransferase (TIGR00027 family)